MVSRDEAPKGVCVGRLEHGDGGNAVEELGEGCGFGLKGQSSQRYGWIWQQDHLQPTFVRGGEQSVVCRINGTSGGCLPLFHRVASRSFPQKPATPQPKWTAGSGFRPNDSSRREPGKKRPEVVEACDDARKDKEGAVGLQIVIDGGR